jgi:ATP-dependent Clp protease protease subunit
MLESKVNILNSMHEYGLDEKARRVWLHGAISLPEETYEAGIEKTIRNLFYLEKTTGNIELWINTPGGYVAEMWGLYDIINGMTNTVTTIGYGEVCSAGGLILACGDVRMATPNCRFMSHPIQGGVNEDLAVPDTITRAKMLAEEQDALCGALAEHSDRSKTWWKNRIKGGEQWLRVPKLLEIGLIDKVCKNNKGE